MKVIVSACLLGENCKYNGGNNLDERVVEFMKDHEAIPVCPEVLGGLPTPRPCCECSGIHIVTSEGDIVDAQFFKGAQEALQMGLREKADFAVLQPRSPSCGIRQVYDGTFSGKLIEGEGVFATRLRMFNIPAFEPDELEELAEVIAAKDSEYALEKAKSSKFDVIRRLLKR